MLQALLQNICPYKYLFFGHTQAFLPLG